MLPLSVALEALRCHPLLSYWSPNKSIFKLVYIFCLPEMAEPLETVKLPALDTEEELQAISSSAVHEGRLVDLVALLLVAREKLLAPIINDNSSVEGSFIGQCILKELALVLDQEVKLMGTNHDQELKQCRQMKDAMNSIGLMLNVFDKAGGSIDRYRYFISLGYDIPGYIVVRCMIYLLMKLEIPLKEEDRDVSDIKCIVPRMNLEESAKFDSYLANITQSRSSLSQSNQNSVSVEGKQGPIQMNIPSIAGISTSSSVKSFHTCRQGFLPRWSVPPRGAQKTSRGMQPAGPKLCWAAHWAFRVQSISKRRI